MAATWVVLAGFPGIVHLGELRTLELRLSEDKELRMA
eukprot:CAMPEP_0171078820 /NCGR_PEP_ID=MMETSP0766_2-20121228/14876_1 /TAXON_ID=439317 /ORGANISM="Gambierdiscus australes, Strain CAWD 149" /LENGTH=36 /DNA_ID= /DNA_START= /DNA_END= /DNA_ORIENTATION=